MEFMVWFFLCLHHTFPERQLLSFLKKLRICWYARLYGNATKIKPGTTTKLLPALFLRTYASISFCVSSFNSLIRVRASSVSPFSRYFSIFSMTRKSFLQKLTNSLISSILCSFLRFPGYYLDKTDILYYIFKIFSIIIIYIHSFYYIIYILPHIRMI